MENLSNTFEVGDKRDPDVTIEMLDYKYIDECNNVKLLEKILKALKSGRDGYFPHLVKTCEEKVSKLNPKSRYLRTEKKILKSRDLPSDEAEKLANGMGEWLNDIKSGEKSTTPNGVTEEELPPVRTNASMGTSKGGQSKSKTKKSQKIKGSDFRAWDKYDAEDECKKVDDPEFVSSKKKKINLSHSVDSSKMTEEEKRIKADKEKDKGNEAFKAGDFEEALAYYSRSIDLVKTAASINNRALSYLRLEKWKDAEKDCNEVLGLEKDNVKAKLRRATALKELGRYEEAKLDLDFVLQVEPNNARAEKIMKEIAPKIAKKGRKMKILEVEEDEPEMLVNGGTDHKVIEEKEATKAEKLDTSSRISSEKSKPSAKRESVEKANESKEISDKPEKSALEASILDESKVKTTPSNAENATQDQKLVPSKPESEIVPPEPPKEVIQTPLPIVFERIKNEAADLFRAGQYGAASDKYTKIIERLTARAQKNPDCVYSHALATLYNNRAACMLKSGSDKACIADCDRVLELKPNDLKALIRRASAYEHMEKYKLAYEDFRAAQAIDWSASQAQTGANRVAKHLRDIHGPNWREYINSNKEKASVLPRVPTLSSKTTTAKDTGSSAKPNNTTPKEKSVINTSSNVEKNVKVTNSPHSYKQSRTTKKPSPKGSESSSESPHSAPSKESGKGNVKDDRRAKIQRDLFAKVKEEGNNLVRKGNYAKAIESYNQCIKICPEEIASYTNRALCHLKLNKPRSAVEDCAKALELDPQNVKALYRRAQASKSLKLYREAESDLRKVLSIEPANKPAIGELAQVQKLVQTSSKRKVPIAEVSDDESSEEESKKPPKHAENRSQTKSTVASTSKTPTTSPNISNLRDDQKPIESETQKPIEHDAESPEKPINEDPINKPFEKNAQTEPEKKSKVDEKDAAEKSHSSSSKPAPSKNIFSKEKPTTNVSDFRMQIPKDLTPYEFGNFWNSVQPKSNVEAYKCILDNISTELIPKIVSNKTTDHLIVTFAQIALKHASTQLVLECDRAYDILLQLTKADRFEMAAMFLSKSDREMVQKALSELETSVSSLSVAYSISDLNVLKKLYAL